MNFGTGLTYAGMGILGARDAQKATEQQQLDRIAVEAAKRKEQYDKIAYPFQVQNLFEQQQGQQATQGLKAGMGDAMLGAPTSTPPSPGQPSVPMTQAPMPGAQSAPPQAAIPTPPQAGQQPPTQMASPGPGMAPGAVPGTGTTPRMQQFLTNMPQGAVPAFQSLMQDPAAAGQLHNLTEYVKKWYKDNPDAPPAAKAAAYDFFTSQAAPLVKADSEARKEFLQYLAKANQIGQRGEHYAAEEAHWKRQDAARAAVASSVGLTPQGLDAAAESYRATGIVPALGRSSTAARIAVINRAAELDQQEGVSPQEGAQRRTESKATVSALGATKRQAAQILSFEGTALKNADLALQASDKVDRTGTPAFNRWLLAGRRSLQGDPEVARLNAAVITFANEYAKVVSSATGGGVTSNAARQEAQSLINAAQTPEQFRAVVDQMKMEMSNRRTSYEDTIKELEGQLRPGKPAAAGSGLPAGWSVKEKGQ